MKNKKGKKFRVRCEKIKTKFYSGFIGAMLGFIALLFISIGGIAVNLTSCIVDCTDRIQNIISVIISAASFILSLIGTIKSAKQLNNNCFHRQFLNHDGHKQHIINEVTKQKNINDDYAHSVYKWKNYDGQWYLYSDTVNKALTERADRLLLKVSPKKQEMSGNQREALYQIITDKIAHGKSIFNSELVRLRTDLLIDKTLSDKNDIKEINCERQDETVTRFKNLNPVEVEKTDYYANLTTNDQIYSQIFKYDYSSVYSGKDFTVDEFDSLFNLSQSPAANIIGVSTIAITKGGYVIINRQNNNNDVNNDCFVPSGSGSSDFADLKACLKLENKSDLSTKIPELKDKIKSYGDNEKNLKSERDKILKSETTDTGEYKKLTANAKDIKDINGYIDGMKKYTCDFKNFLAYGMVRELAEESHISDTGHKSKEPYIDIGDETKIKLMKNTVVCGYIRILDRGGKPDFFGITFLDLPVSEVKSMFDYGRKKYFQKEIRKGCAITDFNEVCEQYYVKLDDLYKYTNVDDMIKNECHVKDRKKQPKISLQLHCLFELMLKNKDEIYKRIEDAN